jgi:transposase-like protein
MKQPNPRREEILQRLNQPGAPSVGVISEETGIPKATLYYWLSRRNHDGNPSMSSQEGNPGMRKRSKPRSPSTKLRLVSESMELEGDALRTWCKIKGVTIDELLGWRDLALSGIEDADGSTSGHGRADLEELVRELEKDVRRKNDALAEAAALLVLQKKTQKLFGEEK